jgi:hypothetical protein
MCIAVLTEIDARPVVVLTDIFKKGGNELSKCDLEDRLSHIWFEVVGKIGGCPLQFRFRAVGNVATHMIEMEANLMTRLGFLSDGLTLLAHSCPAGMSFFIPVRPTVKLRVHINTRKLAILFARAEDGSELFPIAVWRLENETDRLMEGKAVRFEVASKGRDIEFTPVSFSSTDTHDFVSDVRAILEFVTQGCQPKLELAECEKVIRERFP